MSESLFIQIIESPGPRELDLQNNKIKQATLSSGGIDLSLETKEFCIQLMVENELQGGVHVVVDNDLLLLKSIWVEESVKRKGYGLKLYLEVEALAQKHRCKKILLHTYDFFNALQFWERMGFQIAGEIPDCLGGRHLYYLYKPLPKPG